MFSAQLPCNGTAKCVSTFSDAAQPVDDAQLKGLCFTFHLSHIVTAAAAAAAAAAVTTLDFVSRA